MAETASNIPTFKLVLVGDGGTGKVSYIQVMEDVATVYLWKRCYFHSGSCGAFDIRS